MSNRGQKRSLQGYFYQAANGHVSYEIFYAAPNMLDEIGSILISQFGCTRPDPPIDGYDHIITQCRKGNIEIALGWDIWSGFYLLANSAEGDALVRLIGTYLDTIVGGKDFEKYVYIW